MAFLKKIWKRRRCEYPNRRKLTQVPGKPNEVDVVRAEGAVFEEGDLLGVDNLNSAFRTVLPRAASTRQPFCWMAGSSLAASGRKRPLVRV